MKKRFSLLLFMIVVLAFTPHCVSAMNLPVYKGWNTSKLTGSEYYITKLNVEVGQTFLIGDCITRQSAKKSHMGSELKMRYTSSNPRVAKINKKTGKLTTIRKGKTVIIAKYKGETYKCTLNVKKKGALKSATKYKKVNAAAKNLAKYYGKKITSKNSINILKAASEYMKAAKSSKLSINKTYLNIYYSNLIIPWGNRACSVLADLEDYAEKNLMFEGKNKFKALSLEASSATNTVTVKIDRTITSEFINLNSYYNHRIKWDKDYRFITEFTDVSPELFLVVHTNEELCDEEYELKAKFTIKPNSNIMICRLYEDENEKLKELKLYKGDTVDLVSDRWKNRISCTVQ